MHVTKMHGARNDFVVIDRRTPFDLAPDDTFAAFAAWVCDRRAGVGADGVILLERSRVADVRMRTINADGSEAEMCGNGARCAARWLDEAGEGERIAFETDAGIVRTEVVARTPEYLVRVAMGKPIVASASLAGIGDVTLVDAGNPHVVFFRDRVEAVDLERIGQALQRERCFPHGTNVHVAARDGRSLRVRHWERGVGLTMACGTGAVACAAAAVQHEMATSPVALLVPGGRLVVEFDPSGEAYLIGPAVRVFDTELDAGAGAR